MEKEFLALMHSPDITSGPKRALLIIDVQKPALCGATAHVPSAVQMLQSHYDQVIATVAIDAETHDFGELAFSPRPDALVTGKTGVSGLTSHVREVLDREQIREVDVCGLETDHGVFATVLALQELPDVTVRVISTACASSAGEEHHQWGLRFLQRMLGKDGLVGFEAIRRVA